MTDAVDEKVSVYTEPLLTRSGGAKYTRASWYPRYVLGMLVLAYVLNFVDRNLLSVLVEPIKADLGISDMQMGLMGGFSFALLYCLAGIPIARWADQGNRRSIIASGIAAWSIMTMVCGMARSYPQLLLARVGVGIGEAACSPPSHSLIADYFPPEKRATALAIYSMGVPIGVMIGFLCGGWIEYYFDWRTAFIAVGAPGILVAIILRFTVAEPIRGRFEKANHRSGRLSLMAVIKELAGMKSFVYLQLGNAFFAFSGYGLAFWVIPFFIRSHAMPLHEAASYLAILGLLSGVTGAYSGGRLTDKLTRKNASWYFWLPAAVLAVATVGALFMLSSATAAVALTWYFFHHLFNAAYSGPTYAAIQTMVKVEMRSQAVAIHLFISNLIGLGLGPLVVGGLSDYWLSEGVAAGSALEQALFVIVLFNVIAIVALLLGARTLGIDIKRTQAA